MEKNGKITDPVMLNGEETSSAPASQPTGKREDSGSDDKIDGETLAVIRWTADHARRHGYSVPEFVQYHLDD